MREMRKRVRLDERDKMTLLLIVLSLWDKKTHLSVFSLGGVKLVWGREAWMKAGATAAKTVDFCVLSSALVGLGSGIHTGQFVD